LCRKSAHIAAAAEGVSTISEAIRERWLESNAPTAWTNEALAKWKAEYTSG